MAHLLVPLEHVDCTLFAVAAPARPDKVFSLVGAAFLGWDQMVNGQVLCRSTITASLGQVELQLLIIRYIPQVHGLFSQSLEESRPDDEMDPYILLIVLCHRRVRHRQIGI